MKGATAERPPRGAAPEKRRNAAAAASAAAAAAAEEEEEEEEEETMFNCRGNRVKLRDTIRLFMNNIFVHVLCKHYIVPSIRRALSF